MKKVLAILMAMVVLLSMGITAFADGEAVVKPTTGSITLKNATVGQAYSVYKIFDATYSTIEGSSAVSYILDPDGDESSKKVYDILFGNSGTGNDYFNHNSSTNGVTRNPEKSNEDIINYLSGIKSQLIAITTKKLENNTNGTELVFGDLPIGYYMIAGTTDGVVTIDSNTPNVEVIDKNQNPGAVEKLVSRDDTTYKDTVSANIGDLVNYKVKFTATNYSGDHHIKYYQIHDIVGNALWIDFTSIRVKVGNEELEKGYYLDLYQGGGDDTLTTLGNWPENEIPDIAGAQWYLSHISENQFRITIPWIEGHSITGNTDNYSITFIGNNNENLYKNQEDVEITYRATVEYNAAVGYDVDPSMTNETYVSWSCGDDTHFTDRSKAYVTTHGIGILKDDIETHKNLAGAVFELHRYNDVDNTTANINVLQTNIEGVYVVDTRASAGNVVYGNKQLPHTVYFSDSKPLPEQKSNIVVSQANGKIVVLGLEAGTYHLHEIQAPSGYNALTNEVVLEVNNTTDAPFIVFSDTAGKVHDTQQATGGLTEHTYLVTRADVHNSKGVELPSTGGEGTMLFITLGTVIALAFAVLLITQKKMSVYKD